MCRRRCSRFLCPDCLSPSLLFAPLACVAASVGPRGCIDFGFSCFPIFLHCWPTQFTLVTLGIAPESIGHTSQRGLPLSTGLVVRRLSTASTRVVSAGSRGDAGCAARQGGRRQGGADSYPAMPPAACSASTSVGPGLAPPGPLAGRAHDVRGRRGLLAEDGALGGVAGVVEGRAAAERARVSSPTLRPRAWGRIEGGTGRAKLASWAGQSCVGLREVPGALRWDAQASDPREQSARRFLAR